MQELCVSFLIFLAMDWTGAQISICTQILFPQSDHHFVICNCSALLPYPSPFFYSTEGKNCWTYTVMQTILWY